VSSLKSAVDTLTRMIGDTNPPNDPFVLIDARPYPAADGDCKALGEKVLTPSLKNYTDGLGAGLGYVAYRKSGLIGLGSPQEYWISSLGHSCRSIRQDGKIQNRPCSTPLPALCSQSAPLASYYVTDKSQKWQVTVKAGPQSYTG
jgi:hypothetical protein